LSVVDIGDQSEMVAQEAQTGAQCQPKRLDNARV
jgi:hypothetical protein